MRPVKPVNTFNLESAADVSLFCNHKPKIGFMVQYVFKTSLKNVDRLHFKKCKQHVPCCHHTD